MITRTPCNQYRSNVQLWNKSARSYTRPSLPYTSTGKQFKHLTHTKNRSYE